MPTEHQQERWTLDPYSGRPRWARVTADVVRVVGGLSLAAGAVMYGALETSVLALMLLGMVLARWVPAVLDMVTGPVLLLAAWASVASWYDAVWWLDLVVHVLTTGVLALMAHRLAVRTGVLVPGPGGLVLVVTALGALLGVLWELGEWFGYTYLSPEITVGYDDTVGDLTAGVLGALLAALVARRLTPAPAPTPGREAAGRPWHDEAQHSAAHPEET